MVHAGAFFGDMLPALSRAAGGCTVWAFEPVTEAFRCAQITAAINGLHNVALHNVGLGAECSSAIMKVRDQYYMEPMGGGSRVVDAVPDGETFVEVRLNAIDDVVPNDRRVALIHLDVEGFEKEALSGALRTIRRSLPTLIIETLPEFDWLKTNILELGYVLMPDMVDNNHVLEHVES
jgi:FkbM family methyltransferase